MADPRVALRRWTDGVTRPLVLTGAGISAESGIPTFRGTEGIWKVGSRHYRPMELATRAFFERAPDEVWAWYLYRRGTCRRARPNRAHRALAALEARFGDDFTLVTQNVDGLHLRAGNSRERTYEIHGNIDFMRCGAGCSPAVPIPEAVDTAWPEARRLDEATREALRCTRCGAPTRPHVLWFDECYDEENYRWESSMRAARETDLLVVVGTTGATNLPLQIGALCARRGVPLLVVNPEPNPFSQWVEETGRGLFLEGTAGVWVPRIVEALGAEGIGGDAGDG